MERTGILMFFKTVNCGDLSLTLGLPEDKCLPGTQDPKMPYYLIGDDAFCLHKHLLKPYVGHNLTVEKKI